MLGFRSCAGHFSVWDNSFCLQCPYACMCSICYWKIRNTLSRKFINCHLSLDIICLITKWFSFVVPRNGKLAILVLKVFSLGMLGP